MKNKDWAKAQQMLNILEDEEIEELIEQNAEIIKRNEIEVLETLDEEFVPVCRSGCGCPRSCHASEAHDQEFHGAMGVRADEPPGENSRAANNASSASSVSRNGSSSGENHDLAAWCFEVVYPQESLYTAGVEQKEYLEMEVVLDSGAGAHVANDKVLPGYAPQPSALSRAGAAFVAADGGRIENKGEGEVNMLAPNEKGSPQSVRAKFQCADVTRALLSVGLVHDAGLDTKFHKEWAKVLDASGKQLMYFARKHGLYIATVKIPNPLFKGFQRQGSTE